jgi:K+/H+ antiporter YhaU regulatory subunit KhtT
MSNKKFYADDEKSKVIARNSATTKKKARKFSKVLNKSFLEKKVIKNEPSLEEAAMNIKRFELERSSTPNIESICEHCKHDHAQVSGIFF